MKKNLLPTLQIRAAFTPESFNEDDRTVEMVFGTDTPVRMYDWDMGSFMETMSFDKNHVRWERLNGGAPLLNNHRSYDGVNGVLGKVERAWAENGVGKCLVRFSKRADVEPVFQDVKDGILTGVSFGYRVYKYEKTESEEGELPKLRAIDWEPYEVSLAPIQADINASVREKNSEELQEVEIIDLTLQRTMATKPDNQPKKREMTEEEKAAKAATDAAEKQRKLEAEAAAKKADTEAAIKAENARSTGIIELCRKHGLDDETRDSMISDTKVTIEKAREMVLEKLEVKDPTQSVRGQAPAVTVGTDREDAMRKESVSAYLIGRALPSLASGEKKIFSDDVIKESRSHNGKTALDLAKDSLVRGGENISGMSSMEIAGRAFTSSTSDFPILLEGSAQNTLLASYQAASDTWTRFCATGSVNDFREYKRLRMGTFTDLEAVGENGEYKTKKITDADYEKVQASTKGNIINVSRKMIINDDLGAFLRLAQMLGRSAARSIENDVYALLAENSGLGPNMVDGNPLIDASHSNIGASAAPTTAQIDAMRVIMAQQKDKDSNDFLDLRPALVLAPLSLGSTLRVLNQAQYEPTDNKFQKPNVVAGLFSDVIDTPRLTGTAYWMFADPQENPVIEVSFLNGNQSPFMEMQEGFTVDGTKWKIRLDYGVGAVDYRGVVRSPGA